MFDFTKHHYALSGSTMLQSSSGANITRIEMRYGLAWKVDAGAGDQDQISFRWPFHKHNGSDTTALNRFSNVFRLGWIVQIFVAYPQDPDYMAK